MRLGVRKTTKKLRPVLTDGNNKFHQEPSFDLEQDLIVMVKDEQVFDKPVASDIKANVLILSYNRPRMLREAITSVVAQTYENIDCYIVDDGSDFDVWSLISEFEDPRLLLYQGPRISLDKRTSGSRIGGYLNNVIKELADDDIVFFLCDDDVMHPDWVARSITGYEMYPEYHVVAGESWYFHEGEDWRTQSVYGMEMYEKSGIPTAYWSTGSFSHKVGCSSQENLVWKDSNTGHSQDTNYLLDLWNLHQEYLYIPVPALYRREHDNTLSAKLGRKGEDGKYITGFTPGALTSEMVDGMME